MAIRPKYLAAVDETQADELSTEVFGQVRRDMGVLAPPIVLHAALPRLLAAVWIACRETLLAGRVDRAEKEAVASAVSSLNRCPYCVDVHVMMLHATGRHDAAVGIDREDDERIAHGRLREIIRWARAGRTPDAEILCHPPFSAEEAPELIGTAAAFHYINRMVTVFLGETPMPTRRELLKRPLKRLAGWRLSKTVRRPKPPGTSLRLLPEADLPSDLSWAAASPQVAGAFAKLNRAVEDASTAALDETSRRILRRHILAWDGRDPPLDSSWIDSALAGLQDRLRPVGRFAITTALAPYRVEDRLVRAFREVCPDPRDLLGVAAWASFTAARAVARWLSEPARIGSTQTS